MHRDPRVPVVVRCAGVLVVAQGVAGLILAASTLAEPGVGTDVVRHGEAMVNLLLALVAVGFGVALVLGARGIRSHTIVFELIMIGAAGYAAWSLTELAYGVPVLALAGAALYLLLRHDVRAWSAQR